MRIAGRRRGMKEGENSNDQSSSNLDEPNVFTDTTNDPDVTLTFSTNIDQSDPFDDCFEELMTYALTQNGG